MAKIINEKLIQKDEKKYLLYKLMEKKRIIKLKKI